MKIKEVLEPKGKQEITRAVLEALPDWFGVEESREEYIKISADLIFYAAFDKEKPVGFKEFEVFPTLWDEWNPCQVYVIALK